MRNCTGVEDAISVNHTSAGKAPEMIRGAMLLPLQISDIEAVDILPSGEQMAAAEHAKCAATVIDGEFDQHFS